MKKIDINKVSIGMRLSKNVYTPEWRVLLPAGAVLTEGYINKLIDLKYNYLFVEDEIMDQVQLDEVLKEELLINIYNELNQVFTKARYNQVFELKNLAKYIDEVIFSMINHVNAVQLVDYGSRHDYMIGHAVNTCILSLITGLALGLNTSELTTLGLGAVLHDIGINKVDLSILIQPRETTSPEYDAIKQHAESGFEILRNHPEASLLASHVAFQHHEHWDGTGYPRGLKGDNIHKFGKIVAIAESYDALITDRIYRKRVMPHEAMENIIALSGTKFDPELVKVFTRNVPAYSLGTEVILNNGYIGVIIEVQRDFPTRPTIRLIKDLSGNPCSERQDICLLDNPSTFITEVSNAEF